MRKTTVCLPCLITTLCLRAGVKTYKDDKTVVASVIDFKTWNSLRSNYIETAEPVLEEFKRTDIDDDDEEEGLEARRTVPPPTKVKKEALVAVESKHGKKKSPAKSPPRKGERSSQRLKRTFSSTKKPEGASSEKPITLSEKEEDNEDNEPIAKRLKQRGTSKPAEKRVSPSSSATFEYSDVPSPPPSPAHPPTSHPSPRQQQGEEIAEIEAALAAEK
ncbi:uncharacterized protein LOC133307490 [Gastrolobium bilobum]|uniref:uncharacterized protein LOC133307490 n=1 Tax=Gastrolobium bilobum TaxID=150636 RepID=UPI002AB1DD96|nr:uncharacterized protein LOC133307490 [Gastrolobium bilobum]